MNGRLIETAMHRNGLDCAGNNSMAAQQTVDANGHVADYNPHALVGSLLDDEEEPVPLFYFTSIGEAWVSFTLHLSATAPVRSRGSSESFSKSADCSRDHWSSSWTSACG